MGNFTQYRRKLLIFFNSTLPFMSSNNKKEIPWEKRRFWETVKRFFSPAKANKTYFFQLLFTSLIQWSTPIINIILLEKIVHTIEIWDHKTFLTLLIIFFGVMVLLYGSIFVLRYWQWNSHRVTKKRLEKMYISKFILLDNNRAETIGTWNMIATIQTWLSYRANMFRNVLTDGVSKALFIVFALIYIWTIIWWYVLLFVWWIIIIFFGIERINTYAIQARNSRRDVEYSYTRALIKIIHSKFDIIQNNKIENEINTLCRIWDKWYIYHKIVTDNIRIILSVPMVIIAISTWIMIYFIWTTVFTTGIWFAKLTALIAIMGMFSKIVLEMLHFYREITKDRTYIQKLWDIFASAEKTNINLGQWKIFTYTNWNILIKNISFAYYQPWTPKIDTAWQHTIDVFHNFSLAIQWWKKTAFVGESWSWKTTLIKLLAGYLTPTSGDIFIDGQKMATMKLSDYYKHIGYLSQEPSIFDGTIYENLMYALDTIPHDDQTLQKIIQHAKCEFIWDLAKWLDTEIGERWIRLSWGQKQRLAIAKIMLKNPSIILLDEPTSALDSFNEEQISEAFYNLFEWRTVVIVAHRLQTVKRADKIFFFEQGNIVEEGTHNELIKLNGKYKRMLDLQSWF